MSGGRQPNLLFLMTDQLRPDHAGFMPEARFSTPNLAALAEGSTVFANCQSVNPVCMPARSALLTGRYTHQIGALAMSGDLPRDLPTYAQALQRAGYWTGLCGKLHHLQTWEWRTPRGQGLDLVALEPEVRALGFDRVWESAGKQLALKNRCHWCKHLEEKGLLEAVRDYVEAAGANHNEPSDELHKDGTPWPFPEEDHVDVVTGSKAVEMLEERPKDRPFFLHVSFCSPHKPFDPPERFLDAVPEEEIPFVPAPDGSVPEGSMAETLHRLRRAYRGTVALVDEQIGRILETLETQGELDNTLILFTSDHGEMMGDHGRVQKQVFWRQSLTVPTLVRLPGGGETRVVNDPVELTDLTATLLDAAGLDPVEALSAGWPKFRDIIPCRSLLPAVRGEAATREFSFSEAERGWHCVQSRDRKYVRQWSYETPGAFEELFFDVDADPDELTDLAERPEEREALRRHRDYLDWVLAATPPAQSSWAPLGEKKIGDGR